jgi:hypothetical protein
MYFSSALCAALPAVSSSSSDRSHYMRWAEQIVKLPIMRVSPIPWLSRAVITCCQPQQTCCETWLNRPVCLEAILLPNCDHLSTHKLKRNRSGAACKLKG